MNTKKLFFFGITLLLTGSTLIAQQDYYYPQRGTAWEIKAPASYNINETLLNKAINFAKANEYSEPNDLRRAILKSFSHEPFHKIIGPTKKRGGPAGMILKKGHLIASWGDTKRVDMTFSVTKSYLSTLAGLALDKKLIGAVNDKVGDYVWDGKFKGAHNSKIKWTHLLNQSSDWSGELWGGLDWADRPPRKGGIDNWKFRTLREPGTIFEYNDVRVNLLSYSLLQVWRKPLPMVLKEHIMDPIGASSTWRWFGYDSSWVNVDGLKMQSVSGGGHSGGGLFISTEDHARFGLLFLSNGQWNKKQLISNDWIKKAMSSSPANANYGYMWWLNKNAEKSRIKSLSENAYYAAGFGGNYIIIEPDLDLVIVMRWLEPSKADAFVKMILEAVK